MRTGRNDPCPCGSGKKFKRCCGGFDAQPGSGQPASARPEASRIEQARAAFQHANALAAQGHMEQAVTHYEHSLSLREDVAARNNLGNALAALGRIDQAAIHFERVVSLVPEHASARSNLGLIFLQRGRLTEAAAHFEKAIALQPDFAQAHNNLGLTRQTQGQVDQALAHYHRALALRPDYADAHSNMLLALNYQSSDPAEVFAAHQNFSKRWESALAVSASQFPNDRSPERRLRVGYVSSDFRQHSVSHFIGPVLKSHNRDHFEIFCYNSHSHEDDVTAQLKVLADHWRRVAGVPDEIVARQIRNDQIDILVDLNGHTANNRMLVFARKPAPVQVTWLGYPNTTGLSAMDYRITDGYADPVGTTEQFYSETLVRLPETFSCYQPPQDAPPVSELPAREKGHVTLGSFNHQAKLSPEVMTVWAKLLRAIPGSRLVLKNTSLGDAAVQRAVREVFATSGVASERLELLGLDPSRVVHLARYRHMDIGLDPFPYNGATTTCEALWMGVPVVTLAGRTHAGRVGVSQLNNLGLTELIGDTPEAYIDTVVRLASDLERLSQLRREMRSRMVVSPLTDARRFTHNLENAYRAMWRNLVS